MDTKKDFTRKIKNARRRLKTLKERRSSCPEAREAFESASLAQSAMLFVKHLDEKINEEEKLIDSLIRKRANTKK